MPPVPLMVPEYVVLVPSPPVVSVAAAPSTTVPPVTPPPASEPMALLKPLRSSVAPAALASVMTVPIPNAWVATPALSVPAFTVVALV